MQNTSSTVTRPAPETEAVNEADRAGALAEETCDFEEVGYGVAAYVHATLALAAEVRAMRLQLGDPCAHDHTGDAQALITLVREGLPEEPPAR